MLYVKYDVKRYEIIYRILNSWYFRLSSTRDSLWRMANIQSASSVSDDSAAEQIRASLEACNLEEAIARFISGNATGSKRYMNTITVEKPSI